jgi:hypothetical protein
MELNAGSVATDRLIELYKSAQTGSVGVARDWKRMIDFVAEIQADTELRNDVIGNLNARGTSIEDVIEIVGGAQRIRDAILAEYAEETE